jgi:hypothetical protein
VTNKKYITIFLVWALSVLVFAWGTRYLSGQALSSPLVFDEAYNLQISWHLAHDGVYGTNLIPAPGSKEYREYVLNPYITTGPSVLFPIAWFSQLFEGSTAGDGRRVIFGFFTLFVILLPIFLYQRTRRFWVVLPATLFATWIIGVGDWPALAIQMLGEGPGVCYFVLSVFLADYAFRRKRPLFIILAGVMGGLSVHAKLLFLVGWLGVGIWLVWNVCRKSEESWGKKEIALFVAGFLGSLVAWEIGQVFILGGWEAYVAFKKSYVDFFLTLSGGPLPRASWGSTEWWKSTLVRAKIVKRVLLADRRVFALIFFGVVTVLFEVIYPRLFRKWTRTGAVLDPWLALICASGAYHAWFVFSSGLGWDRHYLPAATLLAVGASGAVLETIAARFPRAEVKYMITAFIVLSVSISAFRMSKPLRGALASQFIAQKKIEQFEAAYKPLWVAQANSGFDFGLLLFSETDVAPVALNRTAGFPSVCKNPLPKSDLYVLVTEVVESLNTPRWRCKNPSRIEGFPQDVGYTLEYCSASRLVCDRGRVKSD